MEAITLNYLKYNIRVGKYAAALYYYMVPLAKNRNARNCTTKCRQASDLDIAVGIIKQNQTAISPTFLFLHHLIAFHLYF